MKSATIFSLLQLLMNTSTLQLSGASEMHDISFEAVVPLAIIAQLHCLLLVNFAKRRHDSSQDLRHSENKVGHRYAARLY